MGGDDRAAATPGPSADGDGRREPRGLHRLMKALFELTPWGMRRRIAGLVDEVEAARDRSVRIEQRLDALEEGARRMQRELSELRDGRVAAAEDRLDAIESAAASLTDETARLRDRVVPALAGRADVLLERLTAEIDEVGSLVERMLRREPLPAPDPATAETAAVAEALAEVQPALIEAFRGSEAEIRSRLDRYLDELCASPPVLDLGCGRGELLLMLREAGVEATGIEGDPAVATAARRRGLDVVEGDVLEILGQLPDASRGAVTAIHLFEHLDSARLLGVLAQIRRVLRPGGLLIAECPNPHSLRVGAALYWIDPTHRRPLMPETLELALTASGFERASRELLHPFPAEQLLARPEGFFEPADPEIAAVAARLGELEQRLDDILNGPRDFVVRARTPNQGG